MLHTCEGLIEAGNRTGIEKQAIVQLLWHRSLVVVELSIRIKHWGLLVRVLVLLCRTHADVQQM